MESKKAFSKKTIGIGIILVAVIALAVFWAGSAMTAPEAQNADNSPIRFGFIGPLSGDVAFLGNNEKNALELAVNEINASGGINGKTVEAIFEDGKCNGKEAATAAQKLVHVDKVPVIFGGDCSSETLAIAPVTEAGQVLLFSPTSSSPVIREAGDFVFRNFPSEEMSSKTLADMIFADGYQNIAIIYENNDYATSVRGIVVKKFKGTVATEELFTADEKDFRSQLTKIKEANPDALLIVPQGGIAGGLIAKQARELGIEVPLYGTNDLGTSNAFANGGSSLDGLKFVDSPLLNQANPKAKAFLENYTAAYGKPEHEVGAGAQYDAVYLIRDAIVSCGGTATSCIRDYLYNLSSFDGTVGRYHFDEMGDEVGIQFIKKQIVDGEQGTVQELD